MVISVTINLNHTVMRWSNNSSYARNTCTTRTTYRRQTGHSDSLLPHAEHVTMCPHSSSKQSMTESIHTLHKLLSNAALELLLDELTATLSKTTSTSLNTQVTWLVVIEVRGESFGLVTERRHYNARPIYVSPLMLRTLCFSSSSVVSHALSALCVYSKFGRHPHPLGYLCAKFCFFCGLHCWASPWRKIAYSITHPAHLMHREPKLCFGITKCTIKPVCKLPNFSHVSAPTVHKRWSYKRCLY